jgi:mRNA interferase MazF
VTDASRGDVWLVDFGKPAGHEQGWRRPAVVVSSERMHRGAADLFIVVPTTSTRWRMPSHVEIEPGTSGLDEVSYAKVEDVKSVSGQRLIQRFGAVGPDVLDAIARILRLLMEP